MARESESPTAWSARMIVERVRSGDISATEVVEAHIRRIESTHARLNALVIPLFSSARTEAKAVDAAREGREQLGALAGLPFTVKESWDVAGTPSTMGLTARSTQLAEADAPQVAALRRAGAILLGKTNVSQLLMGNETSNPLYYRTKNPWNEQRAPGGSTGGEAALIAAGGSPLGLGSDIGGSVRLPAHACGIQAIKPTSLSMKGHANLFPGQLAISSQPGLLARTVADLELALRMMDTRSRPGFGDPGALSIRMMRVALYTDNGVMQVAPALRRAVVEAGAALASRGAYVEEWKPPGVEEAWPKYLGILMADGSANARRICQGSKLAPTVRQVLLAGLTPRWFHRIVSAPILRTSGQKLLAGATEAMGYVSADEYWQLLSWQASFRERFLIGLDRGRFDVLICPPDVLPALRHGSGQYLSAALSYSAVYNLLSMPAGVVAVTRVRPDEESDRGLSWDLVVRKAVQCEAGSVGLPVGVQVAAKQHREDIVLCVMKAIEEHFRSLPDYPLHPPI